MKSAQDVASDDAQTTLTGYGCIAAHRQGELVRSAVTDADNCVMNQEMLEQFKRFVQAVKRAAWQG